VAEFQILPLPAAESKPFTAKCAKGVRRSQRKSKTEIA
jgi:hypothetical protein